MMRYMQAIGFIFSMCVRMFGLLVVIAESVVPKDAKPTRDYIKAQREWLFETYDMLELEQMVDDVFKEGDA